MPSTGAGISGKSPASVTETVPVYEYLENAALAATVIGWTAWDLYQDWPRWQPLLLGVASIKLLVGYLLLSRRRLQRRGSWFAWLAAAPSLALGYVALRFSTPVDQWPWWCAAMFLAGCGFTFLALLSLGKSFSVLPALRQIVSRGPYRWVRHPAYLGQLMLVAACCLASDSWWGVLPLAVGLPLLAARIFVEEQLLRTSAEYVQYAQQVRWRLVPGVW